MSNKYDEIFHNAYWATEVDPNLSDDEKNAIRAANAQNVMGQAWNADQQTSGMDNQTFEQSVPQFDSNLQKILDKQHEEDESMIEKKPRTQDNWGQYVVPKLAKERLDFWTNEYKPEMGENSTERPNLPKGMDNMWDNNNMTKLYRREAYDSDNIYQPAPWSKDLPFPLNVATDPIGHLINIVETGVKGLDNWGQSVYDDNTQNQGYENHLRELRNQSPQQQYGDKINEEFNNKVNEKFSEKFNNNPIVNTSFMPSTFPIKQMAEDATKEVIRENEKDTKDKQQYGTTQEDANTHFIWAANDTAIRNLKNNTDPDKEKYIQDTYHMSSKDLADAIGKDYGDHIEWTSDEERSDDVKRYLSDKGEKRFWFENGINSVDDLYPIMSEADKQYLDANNRIAKTVGSLDAFFHDNNLVANKQNKLDILNPILHNQGDEQEGDEWVQMIMGYRPYDNTVYNGLNAEGITQGPAHQSLEDKINQQTSQIVTAKDIIEQRPGDALRILGPGDTKNLDNLVTQLNNNLIFFDKEGLQNKLGSQLDKGKATTKGSIFQELLKNKDKIAQSESAQDIMNSVKADKDLLKSALLASDLAKNGSQSSFNPDDASVANILNYTPWEQIDNTNSSNLNTDQLIAALNQPTNSVFNSENKQDKNNFLNTDALREAIRRAKRKKVA